MNFLIIPDCKQLEAISLADTVIEYLTQKGNQIFILPEADTFFQKSGVMILNGYCSDKIKFIVIIGNDETLLQHLDVVFNLDKPIVGIYVEKPGFLVSCAPEMMGGLLHAAISGKAGLEKRMIIMGEINHTDETADYFIGLNEAVVYGSGPAGGISFQTSLSFGEVDVFSGDSLIITTPSGSAFHSFTAGGPVLMPDLECFMLYPVCSETLLSRPVIFNAEEMIKITVLFSNERNIFRRPYMAVDGIKYFPLQEWDCIIIRKAWNPLWIYTFDNKSGLRLLKERLK